MPQLPETLDDRVLILEQQQIVTNLMDRQQNDRLTELEGLVFTLQAELAVLQGKQPASGQKEGSEGAIDQLELGQMLNGVLQGSAEVEQSVEGRKPC